MGVPFGAISPNFGFSSLRELLTHLIRVVWRKRTFRTSPGEDTNDLAQLPVQFLAGSVKEKLRVKECEDEGSMCCICLACVRRREEVRELGNCSHVFHKRCLDSWVEGGQVTCPLCRSKLLPESGNEMFAEHREGKRE